MRFPIVCIIFLFIWLNSFGQKLKTVIERGKLGEHRFTETYTVIKRGEHKGKRHGNYTLSEFADDIVGQYYYDLKDGTWITHFNKEHFAEYYTRGVLDSLKGYKNGVHCEVHFNKKGDTIYFKRFKTSDDDSLFTYNNLYSDSTTLNNNGIYKREWLDTTFYHYSNQELIGYKINGIPVGKWRWKTSVGTAITQYHEGLKSGIQISYYSNQKIRSKVSYENGIRFGKHYSYYENGNSLIIDSTDSLGMQDGTHIVFYVTGDTASVDSYNSGHQHGRSRAYYPNGNLYYTGLIDSGYLMEYEEFDSLGNLNNQSSVHFGFGTVLRPTDSIYPYFQFENGILIEPRPIPNLPVSYFLGSHHSFDSTWNTPAYFPGGLKKFDAFIEANKLYPKLAIEDGIEGDVLVEFVVNELGEVPALRIIESPNLNLSLEAIRLIKSTSFYWVPATELGLPVTFKYIVPIKFQIF